MVPQKPSIFSSKIFLAFILVVLTNQITLAGGVPLQSVSERITHLCEGLGNKANIGIAIYSVDRGCFLYERNADQMYVPASAMKAILGIAALADMGGEYTFKTSLFGPHPEYDPNKPEIKSLAHLYLELTGDPSFKTRDLEKLLYPLKDKGVTTITGNVYIQHTPWKMCPFNKTWMLEDIEETYGAPVATVIIDSNTFTDKVKVLGSEKLQAVLKPVKDAKSNFTEKIKQTLNSLGIQLTGEVIYGTFPTTVMAPIQEHYSCSLRLLLVKALKDSDNLYSDAIFLRLATRRNRNVETWTEASNALKKIVQNRLCVDFRNVAIADGSGLSRVDLISPRKFIQVLTAGAKDPFICKEISTCLAEGGGQGTLKYRLSDADIQRRIRAKTGSMKGISSLAGYAKNVNGETLAFAIFTNNFYGSAYPYKQLEDKLCYLMCGLEPPADNK